MEKQKPGFEKRLGNIRVAVWQNLATPKESAEGKTWFNVSLTRRYFDKTSEEWKDAHTFTGLADLAVVKEAVTLAMAWIARREDDQAQDDDD